MAHSSAELGLDEMEDPPLLRALAEKFGSTPWVLVTGDDAMPAEHGDVIREIGATIATIHPERPDDIGEDSWRRDIVHRWAHAFQTQTEANVRRYAAGGSKLWHPRKRHLRAIAAGNWTPWSKPTRPGAGESAKPPTVEDTGPEPDQLPGFS